MKNKLTYIYIFIGIAALFFGTITNDLLSLGLRSEIVSIIEKLITALLIGTGLAMQQIGIPVPQLPKRSSGNEEDTS